MRAAFLPSSLILLAALNPARAQIKLPVFDPDAPAADVRNVAFEPAKERADFRHGAFLQVTLNDGAKIRGTLVRVDGKAGKLFVRSAPGTTPRAIEQKDIKSVEKGVRAGKEGIRPAGFQGEIVEPEIQRIVIYNGLQPRVRYSQQTLSPSERAWLRDMEEAENELGRLEASSQFSADTTDTILRIQHERLRSHALVNALLLQQLTSAPWYEPAFNSQHILSLQPDQPELLKIAPPPPEVLSKARDHLKTLQARAVYENDRIVAVALEP
jgi:hypothetical protein